MEQQQQRQQGGWRGPEATLGSAGTPAARQTSLSCHAPASCLQLDREAELTNTARQALVWVVQLADRCANEVSALCKGSRCSRCTAWQAVGTQSTSFTVAGGQWPLCCAAEQRAACMAEPPPLLLLPQALHLPWDHPAANLVRMWSVLPSPWIQQIVQVRGLALQQCGPADAASPWAWQIAKS